MKGLIVWGTSSNSGKSYIVTGLCRALSNRGWKVAPFKGQNMSNNSYVTMSGHEIGRSQGLQALAARTTPTVYMNPVLLKPQKERTSEVLILGQSVGSPEASDYRQNFYNKAKEAVKTSLEHLQKDYDVIVMEGAGSPAEIILMDKDLANLATAEIANVPAVLTSDIERGGVFASITGTLNLLPLHHQKRVKGLIINKFRGDPSLFESGETWLHEKTGIPVTGVMPTLDIPMEEEDSLSFAGMERRQEGKERVIDVAVIALPYVSNYTDMDPLTAEDDINLRVVHRSDQFGHPDVVLLPGTKSTIHAYQSIKRNGLLHKIKEYANEGGHVIGICGGYQMLGSTLTDRWGIDTGEPGVVMEGAGLLPVMTTFHKEKTTSQWSGYGKLAADQHVSLSGFEIHHGITEATYDDTWLPLVYDTEGKPEGIKSKDYRLIGTHIHHLLHNDEWRTSWLNKVRTEKDLPVKDSTAFQARKDENLDKLADAFEKHVDMSHIMKMIEKGLS
ncbi:cobyric acid synthase [Alteribacillus iranensis]|uniref:Cobyric acid synthase n=1 Tax=Alteribacillus iranensis TaxID=930128 RepID=A0A1I1ZR52_9BACI|nr:cobyric acid synthase [Alteribacillus iranensis]SFE33073.1 adenosylcobyric acid synthase (glutamine-hydrolysing) [Alteribacillus iranensis]